MAVKSAVCAGSSHLPTAKPALQADRKATCCAQTSTRGQSATICMKETAGVAILRSKYYLLHTCTSTEFCINSGPVHTSTGVFFFFFFFFERLHLSQAQFYPLPVRKINNVAPFCSINICLCLSKYKPYNILNIFTPEEVFQKLRFQ